MWARPTTPDSPAGTVPPWKEVSDFGCAGLGVFWSNEASLAQTAVVLFLPPRGPTGGFSLPLHGVSNTHSRTLKVNE